MATPTPSDRLLLELGHYCRTHRPFADRLVASLVAADTLATEAPADGGLDPDLYAAFDALGGWPRDVGGYIAYLRRFNQWVPNQSGVAAWEEPGTSHYQEVYDRLCHFYFLIDQPGADGRIVQNQPWFADWIDRYATAWGDFLDTPGSFTEADLASYVHNAPQYRVHDSMVPTFDDDGHVRGWAPNNPSGWNTFNQFFARTLNSGLRPISDPGDNATVTSPADCTFHAWYPIDAHSKVLAPDAEDGSAPRLKGTHAIGDVRDLLKGSDYADAFAGGTFVHSFLAPYSYHRFHTPVAGAVLECYAVEGLAYLAVNVSDGQFHAPDDSTDGYEFRQARGVLVIDTAGSPAGDVGLVAVVPVGMAQVSSVHMTGQSKRRYEATPPPADPGPGEQPKEPWHYAKGEEFGHFLFGGSDIIVLFQKGALDHPPGSELQQDPAAYRHVGEWAATVRPRG